MKFYHVTPEKNLPFIRKGGLIPGADGVTYLWDSLEWAADFAAGAYPGESKVALVVEWARRKTRVDDRYAYDAAHGHAFAVTSVIPPTRIVKVFPVRHGP